MDWNQPYLLLLFAPAAGLTGGALLDADDAPLPPLPSGRARLVELAPLLMKLMLLLFVVDVAIRRWENLQAVAAVFSRRVPRPAAPSAPP